MYVSMYVESFENSRMQYSAYKHLIRKGEQGPAPGPQSPRLLWHMWKIVPISCWSSKPSA